MSLARFFGFEINIAGDRGTGAASPPAKRTVIPIDIARTRKVALGSLEGALAARGDTATPGAVNLAACPIETCPIKTCQWCGKEITRWRLVAYFREPPLCSRQCISGWLDREL
jgi:hypothetical protein